MLDLSGPVGTETFRFPVVHKGPSPCPRCHGESPVQSAVTVPVVEGNEVTERAGWEGAGRKEGESPTSLSLFLSLQNRAVFNLSMIIPDIRNDARRERAERTI